MAQSDDLDELLPRAAVRADALRAAGLRAQLGVTEAQNIALEREQERLSRKLGPEHPRVMALAQRLRDGQTRLRDLGVEVSRAETVAPKAGADDWALHGHVRRSDLLPAPDLTVSLVDAQGHWLPALGFACTDAQGYFRLVAKVAQSEAAAVSTGLSAYIRVADRDRKELYRGEEALSVSPGLVEYQEIVLAREGRGCAPPPEEEVPAPAPAPSPKRRRKPRRPG